MGLFALKKARFCRITVLFVTVTKKSGVRNFGGFWALLFAALLFKTSAAMAKKAEKDLAFTLYMNTDLSQKEIAAKVKVSERVMSVWVKDGEWELKKAAQEIGKEELIRNLLIQARELNGQIQQRPDGQRYATPSEIDTIIKITSSIKNLQKQATLTDYITVCEQLLKYLLVGAPELAKALADPMNEFVSAKAKELQR